MKSTYPRTNAHRLIGHIAKHFKLAPADTLQELFADVDANVPSLPLSFRDLLCVYETFPVFGEFMFPKSSKSLLWQLIESTDAPLLLTDSLISGKAGIFICQPIEPGDLAGCAENIIRKQKASALCINQQGDSTALLYPLTSL